MYSHAKKTFFTKYIDKEMHYFLGGSAWLFGAHILTSVLALVVTVVVTHSLSVKSFGHYRFILAILPFFTLFSLPGVAQSLTRSVARDNVVNIASIALSRVRFGLAGSVLAIIFAGYYWYLGNTQTAFALIIASLFIPFIDSFFTYSFYYKGRGQFKTSAQYDTLTRLFYATTMATTVLITQNILILVFVYLLSQTTARAFFLIRTHLKNEKHSAVGKMNSNDDTIEYGKKLSLVTILNVFANNIDKVLVWHFLGAEALALYVVALLVANELTRGLFTFSQVALPKLSTDSIANTRKALLTFTGITLSAAVVYGLAITPLIHIFFPKYVQILPIALIASILVFIIPLYTLLNTTFIAKKMTKKVMYIQSLDALLSISLISAVLLFTSYGILGVVMATIVRFVILIILQRYILY